MNPCIVVPVTRPSAHKTSSITAMLYNINCFRFDLPARALFVASRHSMSGLHAGYGRGNSHIVDHFRHAVDVGGEFSDEAFFGVICGNAAHGDHAISR
jgi:hypothetical protein